MRRIARAVSVLAFATALLVATQPVPGLAAPALTPDEGQGAVIEQTADGPQPFLSPQATSGCGSICDFKDPATYRIYTSSTSYRLCATDARTVAVQPWDGSPIWIELRYSPWCRTVWARPTLTLYYPSIHSYFASGAKRTSASGFVASGPWTQMLNDAGLYGSACAEYGPTTGCTTRY